MDCAYYIGKQVDGGARQNLLLCRVVHVVMWSTVRRLTFRRPAGNGVYPQDVAASLVVSTLVPPCCRCSHHRRVHFCVDVSVQVLPRWWWGQDEHWTTVQAVLLCRCRLRGWSWFRLPKAVGGRVQKWHLQCGMVAESHSFLILLVKYIQCKSTSRLLGWIMNE